MSHEDDADTVKSYNPVLNTTVAHQTASWTIKSLDDNSYGATGLHPDACYRKTKMNGHTERACSSSLNDFQYEYTYEHTIYLKLPHSLQTGKSYTLEIDGATNSDQTSSTIIFNVFQNISEAIHVNLAGYHTDPSMKSADLYIWMGDGGERDYSSFVGNNVSVYNVATQQNTEVGSVSFWKKSGSDAGFYNLIRSSVWNADFSGFTTPGTYRLVIQGVGCSQEFTIADTIYENVVNQESVAHGATELLDNTGNGNNRNQVWAVAGYLLTPQIIHYPSLHADMKAAIINEAKLSDFEDEFGRGNKNQLIETFFRAQVLDDIQIWDNFKGELVSYGYIESVDDNSFAVSKEDLFNAISNLVNTIFEQTPFRKGI